MTKPAARKPAPPAKPAAPHTAVPHAAAPHTPAKTAAAPTLHAQPTPAAHAAAAEAPARPARPAPARKAKTTVEMVFMVTGTADGEWTVDVDNGKKRVVRGLPVSGAAVSQAAKALAPEVSEAIESVLAAAREAQRAKVEQLQAELAQAQRLLAELSDE